MLTWRLWFALNRTYPAHPMFQYAFSHHARRSTTSRRIWIAAGVFALFCCGLSLSWSPLVYFLYYGPSALMLLLPLLASVLYGALLASAISTAIAHTRENGLYALFAIFPIGTLPSLWMLSVGSLQRGSGFRWVRFWITLLSGVLMLAVGFEALILLLTLPGSAAAHASTLDALAAMSSAVALILLFTLESVQSIVSAALVGIVSASYAQNRLEAIAAALGLFFAVQLGVYFGAVLLCLYALPLLVSESDLHGLLVEISLPLLQALLYYLLRESVITGLWRWLTQRLHPDEGGNQLSRNLETLR